MRHFVKATGMCLLLAQGSAHALSIGNIRTLSALNQRFNADITLSLSAGESPSDIHVQLAPYDKFVERGIPWDRELLKLHFSPVQSGGNAVVIRVKSSGVISEPVLVFLLQASSRKGTSYRQFTVLLDPPADYAPVRIGRPSVESERMEVKPRRHSSSNGYYSTDNDAPRREKRPPAPPVVKAKTAKPYTPPPPVEAKKKPDWVAVRNNDSVSKIAKRLHMGVSYEQMAIALYNANPRAFFSPNINALKAGQTLRLPDRNALNNLGSGEARAEFYRQNRAWKERLAKPLSPQEEPAKPAETMQPAPPQKRLILTAPVDNSVDQYGLLLSNDLNASLKSLNNVEALAEKVQSLQQRLNHMEEQMEDMQKALLLKDTQLAELQNRQTINPWVAKARDLFGQVVAFLNSSLRMATDSFLYMMVGLIEVVIFGLIAYMVTKKNQATKAKARRYYQPSQNK